MLDNYELKAKDNQGFYHPTSLKYKIVKNLYYSLVKSGYTLYQASHEAMKFLTIINPHIKLSEVSKKTFNKANPIYDNYYENNIDNHSHS